ncbi:hypothetical protein TIFTF001_010625 [Ficus carica]|uniref:Uncharacterized protein n=1 Tax=Ficus carica TaxID=3494 RepID=A0AA87ZWT0_FICCA|nr:hypothetical protein TIFTF001_010625 [Ficus carica]
MVSLSHSHVHFKPADQLFGYYSTAQDDRKPEITTSTGKEPESGRAFVVVVANAVTIIIDSENHQIFSAWERSWDAATVTAGHDLHRRRIKRIKLPM